MNIDEDSSSEEDNQMLREALDSRMFSVAGLAPNESVESTSHKSYKDNILNVTPEFQNFVAKRLSNLLDTTIEEFQQKDSGFEPDRSSGIQLFSDSKTVLRDRKFVDTSGEYEIESKPTITKNRKRKAKRLHSNDDEKELTRAEKVRAAAVSPDWILNGESTKGWSKAKGKMYAYRTNKDGVLEEIDLL